MQITYNMPEAKFYILSTRPLSPVLVAQAADNNVEIDTVGFITTAAIRNNTVRNRIRALFHQRSNIIFTSMNAADAVAGYLEEVSPEWNVYCLGTATREIVLQHFPDSRVIGDAVNASSLAERIISNELHEATFFCGDQRRDELPFKLAAKNIAVEEIVVYNTIATPEKIVKVYDGILFFSPSAVESFFSVNNVSHDTVLFAIGTTTAACIRQHSNNKIVESDLPGKKELVEKSIKYFGKSNHTNEHIEK